ncbi:MAG: glycerophosphodiester phosphodiesterase [Candidatus Promineifilaceae bacterium]|nr:glycerophosphodiester phosphodiesterase [Candidatus Promineifilaceae bacterium]
MKIRWLLIVLIILLLALLALTLWTRPSPEHPFFTQFNDDQYPLVIAHADDTGQGLWPGSTMLFLEGVAGMNVDVLELDLHMTRDGYIVVMHDDTVDRTTNGSGKISAMTLEEIKELEVGGNWSPDGGQTFPYRGQGLQVPTLEEVFVRFPDYPMNIEIKQEEPSMAQPLCDLLRENGMAEKVIVPSFSDQAMQEFRAVCPEVATAGSSSEVRNFVLLNFILLSNLLTPTYEAFQVPLISSGIPVVIPSFVKTAHDRNLQVHVWTINDPQEMKNLINIGVDGIMTDRPDILLDILGR